jgi:RND family efflux transporter MFP subunit
MRRSAATLLAVLAALAACARQAANGTAAAPPPPRQVRLHTVASIELPDELAVTGVLAAQEELVLGPEVPGRLLRVGVDLGDVVAKGQELFALDPRELDLAVQQAAAAVATAEARLGLAAVSPDGGELDRYDVEASPAVGEAKAVLAEARLQRDRVAAMVQQNAQSGADLDARAVAVAVAENRVQRARDEVRTNLVAVAEARIALQQAQKRRADAIVAAPWAGRVAARSAVAGQVVAAGVPVLTLLRTDPLRLQLRVPERLAAAVAAGQRVAFTVDGGGKTVREGTVVRQGPAIDRNDRTRLVEAAVENGDGALLPGGFCRASIITAKARAIVAVPRAAIVSFAGVDRAFVVATDKDGATRAKGKILQLGRAAGDSAGEHVEVLSGLALGERIVADAKGLLPELPVAVQE